MFRPTKLGAAIQSCRAVIWLACWIVPKPLRHQWAEKWHSKAWHWANFLAESGRLDARNHRILISNCLGAFAEALWIRYDREKFLIRKRRLLRSPRACLAACFLLLTVLLLAGGFFPPKSS